MILKLVQARDAFYACLEKESGKKPTEIATVGLLYPKECSNSRTQFVNNCRSSWVLLSFNLVLQIAIFVWFAWELMESNERICRWSISIESTVETREFKGCWMVEMRGKVQCHFLSLTLSSLPLPLRVLPFLVFLNSFSTCPYLTSFSDSLMFSMFAYFLYVLCSYHYSYDQAFYLVFEYIIQGSFCLSLSGVKDSLYWGRLQWSNTVPESFSLPSV